VGDNEMSITVLEQQLIPSAKRLISSLRNMGYDFAAAVADLIDNSITAEAHQVKIDVQFEGDQSYVRISDNGKGMTRDQLLEAMRYGSDKDYEIDDLGKFGLGLKTASMSQCHKLTVVTKDATGEINAFCWDLEHIEKADKWELIIPNKKEIERILNDHLVSGTGTVIFWQSLDRMLGQKHPYGEQSRKRISKMCRELEEYVTMVFHRFLAGEVSNKTLVIFLNGNKLDPWDPFARNEVETKQLNPITFHLKHENTSGEVELTPYILPPKDKFSSINAFNRASGPNKWNSQQGFYFYRMDRLIQSGGWNHLRAADEHTKLARIAIDFPRKMDEVFDINVSKMRVKLPEEIRDSVAEAVERIVKEARKIYDKRNVPKPPQTKTEVPKTNIQPMNNPQENPNSTNNKSGNSPRLWTLDEIEEKLIENAYSNESPVILKVFRRLRKKLEQLRQNDGY
jgi:anti-sigma regulatory factor (Ser/Thr protein kinase)